MPTFDDAGALLIHDTAQDLPGQIVLTAAGGWPSTTNGCRPNTLTEYAGNDQDLYSLDFDKDADEFAQWTLVMPSDYNGGTITAVFYWTCVGGGGGETVEWNIQGLCLGDDDAIDQAWGAAVAVSDTWIADGDVHVTAATAAVTLGGTPAASELTQIRVHRDVSDDDLVVDARLLAVKLTFTRT